MGRRKYVDTCCSSCGRETSAWQRDKYPLCNKCDMDSPENIRKYEKCTKFGFTRASVSSWKRSLVCKGT
jgi:hypothetical protein